MRILWKDKYWLEIKAWSVYGWSLMSSGKRRRVVQVRNVSDELWKKFALYANKQGLDNWRVLEVALEEFLISHEGDAEIEGNWQKQVKEQLTRIETLLRERCA